MRAGCARQAITPPLGIPLAGFSARTTGARGVHDDLYARAVVIEDGATRLALAICDLCEIDDRFVAETRRRIEAAAEIPAHAIMIAATHTHAAPATFPLYSAAPDPTWLDALSERLTDTVTAALRDLAPARLAVGVGREATVGRNRRRPDGPIDPTLTVIRIDRDAAAPIHLVHYACHPTVLGPDNLLMSRDFVGFAVDAVERAVGGFALFANGACGDINVGHSADRTALGLPIPGRTFDRAEALGLRLANEAVRVLVDAQPVATTDKRAGAILAAAQRLISVPLRETPTSTTHARRFWPHARASRGCRHRTRAGNRSRTHDSSSCMRKWRWTGSSTAAAPPPRKSRYKSSRSAILRWSLAWGVLRRIRLEALGRLTVSPYTLASATPTAALATSRPQRRLRRGV